MAKNYEPFEEIRRVENKELKKRQPFRAGKPLLSADNRLYLMALLSILLAWGLIGGRAPDSPSFEPSMSPILSFEKTVDKKEAAFGDFLTYNLVVTNTGGSTRLTKLSDSIRPPMVWLDALTATHGIPHYSVGRVSSGVHWTGFIPAHSTLIVSFTIMVTDTAPLYQGNILVNGFYLIDNDLGIFDTRFVTTTITDATPAITPTPIIAFPMTPTPTGTPAPTATVETAAFLFLPLIRKNLEPARKF